MVWSAICIASSYWFVLGSMAYIAKVNSSENMNFLKSGLYRWLITRLPA